MKNNPPQITSASHPAVIAGEVNGEAVNVPLKGDGNE